MEKNERVKKNIKGDKDQRQHKAQQSSEPLVDKSLAWDADQSLLMETPFYSRMDEHSVTLSRIPYAVQRQEYIMRLNNTYGLRYVQRLLESVNAQAKLTVSSPGDKYEQEADRVAEEVTRSIKAPVQRQTPEEEEELQMQEAEEKEPVQMMPNLQRQEEEEEEELIQPKLDIQKQEEEEEEEELLQAKLDIQRQVPEEEEELLQGSFDVHRQDEEEELQMQPQDNKAATVADGIETRINNVRGNGQPLSDNIKGPMEQAFEADFSDVKIHTDTEADTLNKQLNAKAFTTGQDIFFRNEEYSPGSDSGRKLIAHELTHVVQQTGSHTDAMQPTKVSRSKQLSIQRELAPAAKDAFEAAAKKNPMYGDARNYTDKFMPVKHQKQLVNIKNVRGRTKKFLRNYIRAFVLSEYVQRIFMRYKIAPLKDYEVKELEEKYLPKALETRDKNAGLLDKSVASPETQSFLKAAHIEGAIKVTPEQKKQEIAKGPRIDVRSTYWGAGLGAKIKKWLGGYHLFIVYTSSEGKQYYFRAGAGSGGKVVPSMGEYAPGLQDWDPGAPSKTVLEGKKAAEKLDALAEATNAIKSMEVPYENLMFYDRIKLSGENCNATVWTILDMAGIPKAKPFGLHFGWGHRLGEISGKGKKVKPEAKGGPEEPREIKGNGKDVVDIYYDRRRNEKAGTLPDMEPVTLLKGGVMAKIRYSGDLIGWVRRSNLQKLPEPHDEAVLDKLRMFAKVGDNFDDYYCQVAGVTVKDLKKMTIQGKHKLTVMLGLEKKSLGQVVSELAEQEKKEGPGEKTSTEINIE